MLKKSLLAVCGASLLVTGLVSTTAISANAATTTVTGGFALNWVHTTVGHVGQSAPTTATVQGYPAVVVGTTQGRISAYRLSDGAIIWNERPTGGSSIDAALSSDGRRVYATLTGAKGQPGVAAFDLANGTRVWSNWNCGTTKCMHLSGPTVGGGQIFTGGPDQYVHTYNNSTGAATWRYLNTDTTNATPGYANLTGSGGLVVHINDQTPNNLVQPPAQSGGHLRIFNPRNGRQECNANIGGGPTYPGSFNSSAAIGTAGFSPVIAFGTGLSGALPGRVLAFNSSCQKLWISPQLGGLTVGSPIFADLDGNGTQYVVQEVATSDKRAAVYVLNAKTGAIIRQTVVKDLSSGSACTGYAQGSSSSMATIQPSSSSRRQNLVVPAGGCGVVVLDGRNLAGTAQLARSCAVQNTPVVTKDPNGTVGVTIGGYRAKVGGGSEGCIFHYSLGGGALPGTWRQFHHDAQLTGATMTTFPAADTMVSGQQRTAGSALVTQSSAYTAHVQSDGRLVIFQLGKPIRGFGSYSPGAKLVVNGGVAKLVSTAGKTTWSTPSAGTGKAPHFYLSSSGRLVLAIADGNAWTADRVVWHS